MHIAIGVVLVLVAQDGQTLINHNERDKFVASLDCGFFTDRQEPTPKGDSEISRGATPL